MTELTSISVAFYSKDVGIERISVHFPGKASEKQLELMERLETTNGIDVTQAIKLSELTLINDGTIYGVRLDYSEGLPMKWNLYRIGDTGNELLKVGDY